MSIGSALARHALGGMKRGKLRPRSPGVMGLCVHTTGGGIVESAEKAGSSPTMVAVEYYLRPDSFFPNYVCGYAGHAGGELVQVCDEGEVALHAGLNAGDLSAYRDGSWRKKIDAAEWDRAWAPLPHPLHLYPGSTPNRAFVGLELLPLAHDLPSGLRFSDAQHETVIALAADMMARYAIPPDRHRFVGHEDLTPLTRWDKGGGWDPGARRARPRFDWVRVHAALGIATQNTPARPAKET